MTRPFETPIPQAQATRAAVAAAVPVLGTERLVLRAPRAEDWRTLEPIWRSDRARCIGGPLNEEDAWLDFSQAAAGWVLRGIGYWTVTLAETGEVLGYIGIGQETCDPEPEFGWLLTEAAEGHGYASEAARAVSAHAFGVLGLTTLISIIHKDNHRSVAVAKDLGARPDPAALSGSTAAEDTAYRHLPPEVRP